MQRAIDFSRLTVTAVFILAAMLVGQAASGETISLQWDPNPETEVLGYRVYVGTESGVYTSSVDVGNTVSYIFPTAVHGQRYCFAVAAYSVGPTVGGKSAPVCTTDDQPPTLSSPGNQTNPVGVALNLPLVGSDPEGSPVTYSAVGLPTGLSLTPSTGLIAGTPTAVGTFNTTATVSDGGLSSSQSFSWTIQAALPGAAAPLRPTGATGTATPTFEWESVPTATRYRLWVDDASPTDPRIQTDYTPAQAGCTTSGAVCHVSPGVVLAAGRASWSIRASNASGDGPWSGAMDFTIPDGQAPAVVIASPTSAPTYTTGASTVAIGGTATDNVAVTQVTWVNDRGGSGTAVGTAAWAAAAVPLKAGANVITVTARDADGNTATDVVTVTKTDGQAPSVGIVSPTTSPTYSTTATSIVVSGTASDEVGVTQVTWANSRGGSGTASGTTTWTIAGVTLQAGANVITVTARDAAGNNSTDVLTATLTDGVAPTISIASPTAAATFSTSQATVALGGVAADGFGVAQVLWSNNRGGSGAAAGTTAWTVAAVSLQPGANVITVTASDAAGNTASDVLTITQTDGTAPTVTISAPTAAATLSTAAASVALGGTASDAFGVTEVSWSSNRGGSGVATGTGTWTVAAVALEPGANVITVTARDAAGLAGTDVLTVTRTDGTAPTIDITAPVSASTYSTATATIALSGAAADAFGVAQVTWSNNRGGSGTATGTTTWSVAGVALQPGTNVLTVTARDTSGNTASDVLTVTLTDAVAPVVTIATPTAAATYATTSAVLTIGGSASDTFGVTEVRWSNDRGGSGTASGTTTWSAAGVALQTGVNVITVAARDAAGNTSTDVLRVTSDSRAPSISITGPTTAATVATHAETLAITGTAGDDVGVTEVTWSNNRGGTGTATGTATWSAAGVVLQTGANVITVTARDEAGNRTTATLTVTRDSRAPGVAITAPTAAPTFATSATPVTLRGTASDDTAVTQVSWANSRGGSGNAVGTAEWVIAGMVLQNGANVITVTARDAAGNTATASVTVTLDNRAPVVAINTPTNAAAFATTSNGLLLGGTSSDDSSVVEVTWVNSRGGSGVATGTTTWSVGKVGLQTGVNEITVTARDLAGNTASAAIRISVSDRQAPTVRIHGPSPEPEFSTASRVINVEGTALDDFSVSQIAWANDRGGSGVARGTANWIAGGITLQPGVNTIAVTALDGSGNASSDVIRVTYDGMLPTVSITAPTPAPTFTSEIPTVTLAGTATDDAGIREVVWTSDKGRSGVASGTTNWSIPGLRLDAGTNVFTVSARDGSGNVASATIAVVYADATAPTVKIFVPTTAATHVTSVDSVVIGGTANDEFGVTQVTWANNRGGSGTAFGTSGWSVAGVALAAGSNVITVSARDARGNVGTAVLTIRRDGVANAPKPTEQLLINPSVTSLTTSEAVTAGGSSAAQGLGSSSSSTARAASVAETAPAAPVPPTAAGQQPVAAAPSIPSLEQVGLSLPASIPTPARSTAPSVESPRPAAKDTASPPADKAPKDEAPRPPVVSIVSPTSAGRVNTTSTTITVGGTASHASGITRVVWATNKGEGGEATGSSRWSIPAVAVKPGTTLVTVTAVAANGATATAVLTVTRPDVLPKLSVSVPTADSQWTTTAGTVALRGTATDNVTRVTWSADTGASGTASGTESWNVAGIGLREGVNKVTLTAQDAEGRTDRHVLTITYRPRPGSATPLLGAQLTSQVQVGLE